MVEECAGLDRQGLRGWTPLAGVVATTSSTMLFQFRLGGGGGLAVRTGSVRLGVLEPLGWPELMKMFVLKCLVKLRELCPQPYCRVVF